MTTTVSFYGASDDLVEVDGCEGADEFDVCGRLDKAIAWRADLIAPGTGTPDVHGIHIETIRAKETGCWAFALGQVTEDDPLPDWPIRITAGGNGGNKAPGYSTYVEIDVPDGTCLTNIRPKP